MPRPPVREQLRGVEQPRLLLDLVQDHEANAVIEPPHRIGRQLDALVRIVKGEVDGRRTARCGKDVASERRLAGLAGGRQDRDGTGGEPLLQAGQQAARVQGDVQIVQSRCKKAGQFCSDDANLPCGMG